MPSSRLLVSAGLSVCCLTAALDASPPVAAGRPRVRIDEPEAEWGTLLQGDSFSHAFTVHNDGDAPLVIKKARSTCGCLSVEHTDEIAPGATGEVRVTVETGRLLGPDVLKHVTLETNDRRKGPVTLSVTGAVLPLLAADPALLELRVFPGEIPRLTVTLTPASALGAEILAVKARAGLAQIGLEGVEEGARYRLSIAAPARDRPENISEIIDLDVRTTDGRVRKTQLALRIEHRRRWEIRAPYVNFRADQTAPLAEEGAAPAVQEIPVIAEAPDFQLALREVRFTGAPPGAFSHAILTDEPGRRYRVQIRLHKVFEQRVIKSAMVISTDDPLTPERTVHIRAYF